MSTFQIKSADELAQMGKEDLAQYMTEKREFDSARLKSLEDGKASREEIQSLKAEIIDTHNKRIDAVMDILKTQGEHIVNLGKAPAQGQSKTVVSELTKNAEALKAMARGGSGSVRLGQVTDFAPFLSVKVPGDMTLAGNVTGQIPQAMRLPGYDDIPQRQVRLLDLVQRGSIESNIVEWVYMENEDGTTGQTAEGAAKNQIDFDWNLGSERVEKTTNYIKISTEMLADIPFMETAVRTQLSRKLLQAVESQVYSGNGTTPNLRGIRTVASAFSAGSFAAAVDNANNVDVLTVAMNQIKVAQLGEAMPNAILMNPTDVTALKLIKVSGTDKRYVERLWMNAGSLSIDGVPIIETTLVTAGTYLVGDFTKAYLLDRMAPTVQIGLDQDDFTKNFRTLLAEWRGVSYVMNNDRSAFVAGTFATDAAALETI